MSADASLEFTFFSAFSDNKLYSFFREKSWRNLDESTKQQLCQEIINREAQSLGMVRTPKVSFSRDIGNNYGVSGGNHIRLNARYFVDAQPTTIDKNGNIYNVNIPDANLQALNTLFHENQHTYQEQIIDNEIKIDNHETELQYRANDFTKTPIQTENGLQTGFQYLSNADNTRLGYYAYYLQSTERDAYIYAEKKTAQVREMLTEQFGDELSFQINRIDEELNGYQSTLEKAKNEFGVENIEREINKSLVNHRYNTNYTVNPKVDKFVEHEMVRSYQGAEEDKVIQINHNEDIEAEPFEMYNTNQSAIENETIERNTQIIVTNETGVQYYSETTEEVSVDTISVSFDNDNNDLGVDISSENNGMTDSGIDGYNSGIGI